MLKVSGLRSEHSDQVSKLLKYVADVSRKIEEKHQVCSIQKRLKNLLISCIFKVCGEGGRCVQLGSS